MNLEPEKIKVVLRRHVYSYYPYISVCPRHNYIIQSESITAAKRFESIDEATDFLMARKQPLDFFHFLYVTGDDIIGHGKPWVSDYQI